MSENKRLLTKRGVKGPSLAVYFENGGEVPEELSGLYTSERQANKAIDLYLATRRKRADGSRSDK